VLDAGAPDPPPAALDAGDDAPDTSAPLPDGGAPASEGGVQEASEASADVSDAASSPPDAAHAVEASAPVVVRCVTSIGPITCGDSSVSEDFTVTYQAAGGPYPGPGSALCGDSHTNVVVCPAGNPCLVSEDQVTWSGICQ
jgi:hypothetical protein